MVLRLPPQTEGGVKGQTVLRQSVESKGEEELIMIWESDHYSNCGGQKGWTCDPLHSWHSCMCGSGEMLQ